MENLVLIVDDVAKNIQIVANVLQPLGYKIIFAQNGQKTLEILEKENPDLILLDIMMPEMDGFEVCRRIKAMPDKRNIPIIFLTAKTDIDSIKQGFKTGGIDYIVKPFNNDELVARVNTHVTLHNSYKTIQAQNEELNQLNKTKDKFFSIIAHDLRNPFNALFVLTDILKNRFKTMPPEEAEQMMELLYTSTKDGYELLENLLLWTRSQRNKLEFNPVLTDLRDIAQGNIQLLSNLASGKKIELVCLIKNELQVFADQNMIDTILRNLITNAIKFTPENGKVTVNAVADKDRISLHVDDTGVGIEPQDLNELFETNNEHSTLGTASEKGTGLGLVLCKEFVEKHGGEIWVESKIDEGSSFRFSIPKKISEK